MSGDDNSRGNTGQTHVELAHSSPFEAPEHEAERPVLLAPTVSMGRRVAAGALDSVFVTFVWARAVSDALIALGFAEPMYTYSGDFRLSDSVSGRLFIAIVITLFAQGIPVLKATTLGGFMVGLRFSGENRVSQMVALASLVVTGFGVYGAVLFVGGQNTHSTATNVFLPSAWVYEPGSMYLFLPVTLALFVNLIPMLRQERTVLELATGAVVDRPKTSQTED